VSRKGVPFARDTVACSPIARLVARKSAALFTTWPTGQQLLSALSALSRMVGTGASETPRHSEMLDLVVVGGQAKASSCAS